MLYSDIFNVYKQDNTTFINILKKIQLPEDKTIDLYTRYIVSQDIPWTSLSYKLYGDLTLYWLILLANNDKKLNPLFAEASTELFIIKPLYVEEVIKALEAQL